MKARPITGTVLVLIGLLWILQGVGAVGGSAMSGHARYAVLGAVVAVVGAALILWGAAARHRRP